jgi:hypothetical protein
VDDAIAGHHARKREPAAGHRCLAHLVQGTICKILGKQEVKPHKVRYYLENRDAEFERKMAEVLCVYREVAVLKKARAKYALDRKRDRRNRASPKRIDWAVSQVGSGTGG